MESTTKFLGHPVHPMLVVLPLGFLIGGVAFDAIYFWLGISAFSIAASLNIAAGIVTGLAAAVFGIIDWFSIPNGTRAKRIGLMHGGSMVLVVAIFTLVWLLRGDTLDASPSPALFSLEIAALMIAAVGGWLGGELVDRLGVGVDDGANLNAPNSLSGRAVRPVRQG